MAAFTSKATGNWSSGGQTTWNETGVPGLGDTVTIGNTHVVTVDVDTYVGSFSGTDVTISAGGELDIANSQTLKIYGSMDQVGDLVMGDGATIVYESPQLEPSVFDAATIVESVAHAITTLVSVFDSSSTTEAATILINEPAMGVEVFEASSTVESAALDTITSISLFDSSSLTENFVGVKVYYEPQFSAWYVYEGFFDEDDSYRFVPVWQGDPQRGSRAAVSTPPPNIGAGTTIVSRSLIGTTDVGIHTGRIGPRIFK